MRQQRTNKGITREVSAVTAAAQGRGLGRGRPPPGLQEREAGVREAKAGRDHPAKPPRGAASQRGSSRGCKGPPGVFGF